MKAMVATVLIVAWSAGCAGSPGAAEAGGWPALMGVDGHMHQVLDSSHRATTVLIFITTDCPIANGYAPEIKRIIADYDDRPVKFHLVHVDRRASAQSAQEHARLHGYGATSHLVLLDPQHKLVNRVGATVTPEAAVLGVDGELLYRGRIDDRYVDFGKKREAPSAAGRDLRAALDAVIAGRDVPNPRTKAIGCFIPK